MEITRLNTECINCILNKYLERVPENICGETRLKYTQELLRTVADASPGMSAPQITAQIVRLRKEILGYEEDYADIKRHFNTLMMLKQQEIKDIINAEDDSLKIALKYAMLGNYIDFGAMEKVDEEKLSSLLSDVGSIDICEQELYNLKSDLKNASKLVYLTDNCGEIVMDKLLIETILNEYPHIEINVIVRGEPVLNDATIDDAVQTGLNLIAPVTDNGTAIAGTCLSEISEFSKSLIDNSDIIISKGQGNFETLRYCGKNIYYLFMCKCKMFAERFSAELYSGMFLNDLRMKEAVS